MGNLKVVFRGLSRSPLFAAVAVVSLALGIGVNTAIFSLLDQILLRTLPVQILRNWRTCIIRASARQLLVG
jgi:hypothetical protein